MNATKKPFFIFENSLGNEIRCYDNEKLNSLWDRLSDEEKLNVKIYIEFLDLGIIYGAEIKE